MDIGKRVRDAREARGMTQEELARRAGVPLNRVGRIETGTVTDPHYSTLSRIAGGLDVSVGELLQEPVPLGEAPGSGQSEEERGEGHIVKLSGRSVTRSETRGELTIITEALRELDEWFNALEPRIQQEVEEEFKTIHRKLASREHA